MLVRLRDWWRGYSDDDLRAAYEKTNRNWYGWEMLDADKFPLTSREWGAMSRCFECRQ